MSSRTPLSGANLGATSSPSQRSSAAGPKQVISSSRERRPLLPEAVEKRFHTAWPQCGPITSPTTLLSHWVSGLLGQLLLVPARLFTLRRVGEHGKLPPLDIGTPK